MKNEEKAAIDANYGCATIYLKSKQEKKAKEFLKNRIWYTINLFFFD